LIIKIIDLGKMSFKGSFLLSKIQILNNYEL